MVVRCSCVRRTGSSVADDFFTGQSRRDGTAGAGVALRITHTRLCEDCEERSDEATFEWPDETIKRLLRFARNDVSSIQLDKTALLI